MHIYTSMNRTRRKVPREASQGKASEYPRAERHAARKRGCSAFDSNGRTFRTLLHVMYD